MKKRILQERIQIKRYSLITLKESYMTRDIRKVNDKIVKYQ